MNKLFFVIILFLALPTIALSQTPVCTTGALSALKPMPELTYACDQSLTDFDEKMLKTSDRLKAIRAVTSALRGLTDANWWTAKVSELNACDIRRSPGELSDEQAEDYQSGNYFMRLFGDETVRLVVISDPCYQTGFGGSNLFLLHRVGNQVRVTQAIDGYYSRADRSVGLNFANLEAERLIEISTGTGGLQPYLTNYYFTIDPNTKQLGPKYLFRLGRRTSNKITSAAVLSGDADELRIIVNGRLAPRFNAYGDDANGRLDDNGRTLTRKVFRWNGRFYSIVK